MKEMFFSPYEEITRIALRKHLNETGIMQKKISQQCNISTPSICLFLSGSRPIGNRAKLELIRMIIVMEL